MSATAKPSPRLRRAILLLAFAGTLALWLDAALADRFHTPEGLDGAVPSPVVVPEAQSELTFEHAEHLGRGAGCENCHADVDRSIRASDALRPGMNRCLDCHVLQSPSDCARCHPVYGTRAPNWPEPPARFDLATALRVDEPPPLGRYPAAELVFSHRQHTDTACTSCHGDPPARSALMPMEGCLDCHDDEAVDTRCASCHPSDADGRLTTALRFGVLAPTGRYRGDDHRQDPALWHASVAAADPAYCAACHTTESCEDCHRGLADSVAVHPIGYAAQHSFDAQQQSEGCYGCHDEHLFCASCHERVWLGEANSPPTGAAFHPADFLASPASQDFHGAQARRELGSCVSCHSEDTCIRCHAAIDPHPAGFADDCGSRLSSSQAACAKCHELDRLERVCPL